MDFKGPARGSFPYLLTIVDEFSRYPFVFPSLNTSSHTVIESLSALFCIFGFPAYINSDRGAVFVSRERKQFLCQRGIATSLSSPYHPQGNSQCERANQTMWKTIKLLLHSRSLPEGRWEEVLPEALHAVRSLLCTATNNTPHERLFSFPRRAMHDQSLPSWLFHPGIVLLRRFVRQKGEDLFDPAMLLDANASYAQVRHADGRVRTVSTSDLAQFPSNVPVEGVDSSDLPLFSMPPSATDSRPVTDSQQIPAPDTSIEVKQAEHQTVSQSPREENASTES